ncbi:ATP-grasp domain-containing protein [Frateuria aurantia]
MAIALNPIACRPRSTSLPSVPPAPVGPHFRPQGLAALLRRSFHGEDLRGYAQQLIAAARTSDDAYLLLELSLALQLSFQRDAGLAVLEQAILAQQSYQLQRCGHSGAPRLLVIKTLGDLMANTPIECILERQPVDIDVVYVTGATTLPELLPEHDLIFVAIAEAGKHIEILLELSRRLSAWPRPVLNRPEHIPQLARHEASRLLGGIQGLHMPVVSSLRDVEVRALTEASVHPLSWVIRPQGTHAGQGFARIASAAELEDYLAQHVATHYFVAPFVEYASGDGLYRKYRIVMIDGKAYPCHMGISEHWMVHYPYPEMKADPDRRSEEARFMQDFDRGFGRRHGAAMQALQQRLGLDYLGFDCAETPDGDLLIFEVANALVIHAMDLPDIFPYKAPQMHRVFSAFTAMLHRHVPPHTA